MRTFLAFLVLIAVMWSLFAPSTDFNIEVAMQQTVSQRDLINPIDFFWSFVDDISRDVRSAVGGFENLSSSDNVLDFLRSFFPALGNFFKYAFYTILDVVVAPLVFALDCLISLYNIAAIWFGLPHINVWISLPDFS